MAKESMKAREVKRAKMVAKYAEKRAALIQVIPLKLLRQLRSCSGFRRMQILFVCTTVVS